MIGMSNYVLSFVFFLLSLFFLIYTVYQIKRKKLLLKYSLMWFLLSLCLFAFAIFPKPIFLLAHFLGFNVESNFIFSAAIFFLLLLCLGQSKTISQQVIRNKDITQEIALLNKKLDDLTNKLQ